MSWAFPTEGNSYYFINTTNSSRNFFLPPAALNSGRILMIKDQNGNASQSTIYISPTNTDTIERYTTAASTIVSMVIRSNYGSMTFGSDGISNWMILQNYTSQLISSNFKVVAPPQNLAITVSSSTGVATMSWSSVDYSSLYTWILYFSSTNSYTNGQFVSTGSVSGTTATLSTTTATTAAGYYYFTVLPISSYSSVETTAISPIVQSTYSTSSQGPVTNPYIAVANNIATMTWSAFSGATGYGWTLFQSASANIGGAIIATGTSGSTYLIASYSGLIVGAYYYFAVYATTASANSRYGTSTAIQYNNTPPTGGAITLNSIANSTNVTVTISSLAVNATDYAIYISPTTSTANAVYTIHTTTTLSYTGSPQTYTVPPSVTSLVLYAWGAGGGGAGTAGGAGAFLTGNLVVTPNRQYYAFVGGGGGAPTAALGGYSGGGAGQSAGGGGGYSGLFTGLTPYQTNAVVVVGGGGGSGFNAYNALYPPGAYGGSATFSGTAQAGGYEQTGVGGGGGTQSAGGAAGGAGATAGSALQGGNALGTFYSGGGGGGYWGGGGGYYAGSFAEGGGGGGSSYAGSVTSVTGANTLNAAATSIIAPGSTNLYYVSGVAISAASSTGGTGLIAVSTRYTSGQAISLTLSTRLSAATNYYAILVPKNGAGSGTAVISAAVTSSSLPTGGAITLTTANTLGGSVTITSISTGATGYYLYISTTTSTSGAVFTTGTITTLAYTGAIQSYTVPTGITSLTVYLWGAGGGGSQAGQNAAGGAGSFITGTMTVTAGTTYYVVVGGGGTFTRATGTFLTNPGGYGGGGQGYYAAGGGGYSGIFTSNTPSQGAAIVIAGGGGGAGLDSTNDYGGSAIYIQDSAQAGGTNGANSLLGGGGATASAGGIAGTFSGASGAQAGVAGSALTGGNGGQNYGGGGGGGYWGGGGGAYQAGASGGGGGNSFINLSYMSAVTGENSVAIASTATTAPAATNQFYVSGVAASAGGASGGNGLVVISAGAYYTANQVVPFTYALTGGTTYYAILVPFNSFGTATPIVSAGVVASSSPVGGGITLNAFTTVNGGSVVITSLAAPVTDYIFYISRSTSISGAIFASAGSTVYNYTGATQTFTVPGGVTSLDVAVSAAGGSGGTSAGAGAVVYGTLAVTPASVLTIYVGGTGTTPLGPPYFIVGYGGWPGGGTALYGEEGGGGGGYSAIANQAGSTYYVIAGAGGGGTGYGGTGGAGGQNGNSGTSVNGNNPATGGTQSAGGTGTGGGTNGGYLTGGNAASNTYDGGGGGAGYYGGGGGPGGGAGALLGGGGGGSSLTNGPGFTLNTVITGGGAPNDINGTVTIFRTGTGSTYTLNQTVSFTTTLEGNKTYYAILVAYNGNVPGTPIVSAGRLTPALPTGGSIVLNTANTAGGTVTITAATNATGYTVYISTTTNTANSVHNFTTTTTGSAVAFSTTLTLGTTYYALMIATNAAGNGPKYYSAGVAAVSAQLYSFTTATFNTSGATGQNGPTLSQARAGMTGTPAPSTWNTNTAYFNMTTQGYQRWTVPATRNYTISCAGAYSISGGSGARLNFTASLTVGHIITIVVGQNGVTRTDPCGYVHGSGGGGSFIFNSTTSVLLAAAGGGGGRSQVNGSTNANTTLTNGNNGTGSHAGAYAGNAGAGGTNGNGGNGAVITGTSGVCGTPAGGGGGGYSGNGTNGSGSTTNGGLSYTNGATGGTSSLNGGFGGGAGSGNFPGGGGGGYSGGGGGYFNSCTCAAEGSGGGGGSFCYVATSSTALNAGNGFVTIT